jgi:BASS family bile acid:Na+ symporter
MLAVALSMKVEHFMSLRHQKKAVATGLLTQYLLLPAFTLLLILLWSPSNDIALGMILVAACPGGNASNFFSLLARGNVALSVTLTAISSLSAFILTPLSFLFWSSLIPSLRDNVRAIEINFQELFFTMAGVLLLPLVAGIALAHVYPSVAARISRPARVMSMLILLSFIVIAFLNNMEVFLERIYSVFWLVLFHNGVALFGAYYVSMLMRNSESTNRSVAIETGIQNSGLGLVIIFTFFDGNSDMALVTAWWAIWHLVSGFCFAYFTQRRLIPETLS